MNTKSTMLWLIVAVILAIAIVGLGKSLDLFSAYPGTTSWHFRSGCSGDKCYAGNYNIGDLAFSTPPPIYLKDKAECQFTKKWVAFPEPNVNCWVQSFTFDKKQYSIKPYETIKLNSYIEAGWVPSAIIFNGDVCHSVCSGSGNTRTCSQVCKNLKYEYDWQEPDYINDFSFSFYDMSWFKNTIKDKHLSDTIDSEAFVTFDIFDDLTNIDGGADVRESSELFSPANSKKIEFFKVYKGTNTYKTSISTETLGDQNIQITPFAIVRNVDMDVSSNVYVYTNSEKKELRVLPTISNIPSQSKDFWLRNVPTLSPPNADTISGTPQSNTWIWWVVGIVLILLAIYYFKEKQ